MTWPIWYDRQGNQITIEQLAQLHDGSYVQIAEDVVRDVTVSTVWLGIDHSFGFGDKPIIFETMIFGEEYDNAVMRYCTEEEAVEGHREAVIDVTAGAAPWWKLSVADDEALQNTNWPDAWVMRVDHIADEIRESHD